ncbi:hypothetical protein [Halorarum halobium]|uniref:hypothetical protein n=1 Tax=Halorarum halobium TaxID=3075121 RepID=UPI0028B235D0|nr:hypothetical protein [Halobaculum sp. XH14]
MGLRAILSKIVSSRLFPPYLLYKLLEKLNLLYIAWFLVLVLPSLIGTYANLIDKGVHPLISVFATVGIQFGGQAIEVWNAFWQIQGASVGEALVIFFGSAASILRFLWYYYVFNWIADNMEPTVSNFSKFIVGTFLLAMSTIIALMVDLYALPAGTHLSGYTYVLANPGIVLDPLSQIVVQSPAEPAEALNRTLNNSSVGG